MRSLPVYLLTRLLSVFAVLLAVAAITYVMLQILRPELFGDPRWIGAELVDYLRGVFFHLDFGDGTGRQTVGDQLKQGFMADVSLLAGGMVIGFATGLAGGAVCANHPRSKRARLLEVASAFFICAPTYWVGLMAILLFNDQFGALVEVPGFSVHIYEPLTTDPIAWLRSLIVPWLVVAAPLFGMCLRMTRAAMIDAAGAEFLRTAEAKGLTPAQVTRRHALPVVAAPALTLTGASMAITVTNVVLVEQAFSIPGVFSNIPQALDDGNFPLLQGMALAAALLVASANLIVDALLAGLDPRVRAR